MPINFNLRQASQGCGSNSCVDKFGCPSDRCPDFVIRRHDTKPAFKVALADCDGPLDLEGLVVEVSMWAKGRLKTAITAEDEYFALKDDVGFEQVMVGDIILMDRVRLPEYMLVTGFDEENKLIQVDRGYRTSTPSKWKKGTAMRIFRIMDAPAQTEVVYEDIVRPDNVTEKDVLQSASVVYEWQVEDTCLPGCYWLEFKVMKMLGLVIFLPGGNWTGPVNVDGNGVYWTGSTNDAGSVRLSYDSVNDLYLIPTDQWTGETHLYSGSYYTGSEHSDSSLYLDRTDRPVDSDTTYSNVEVSALATSVVPSFTDEGLTPADFGCILGAGVEWVRRFPLSDEGFLIKISNSFTAEQ
jgi:hypothetical protein